MKWIAWFLFAAACQRGRDDSPHQTDRPGGAAGTVIQLPRPTVTAEYKQDIANLCDAVERSGAAQLPAADRAPTVAMWLGPHIRTEAGREFLAAIQPLVGEPKAMALEAEAKRVGLGGCPLAAEWR